MIELPSEVCSVGSARLGRDQLDELRVQWDFDLKWPAFCPACF